jgi:hypothetical protein
MRGIVLPSLRAIAVAVVASLAPTSPAVASTVATPVISTSMTTARF